MPDYGERLKAAIKEWGSVRGFMGAMKARGVTGGTTYHTLRSYFAGRTSPPAAYLEAAAEVLGVRPEWLIAGRGPRTEAEEDLEQRKARNRSGAARQAEHELADAYEVTGHRGPLATRRRAALSRFNRKLGDAEFPGAPWSRASERQLLLTIAARFLLGVEAAFERAGLQDPEAPAPYNRAFHDHLLLRDTSAGGSYVIWSDAVLDLFARRVLGLGERTGKFFDAHAPTAAPRRLPQTERMTR